MTRNTIAITATLLLGVFFQGCSNKPISAGPAPQATTESSNTLTSTLEQAKAQNDPAKQAELYLIASKEFADNNLYSQAEFAYLQVAPAYLKDAQLSDYHLLGIELSLNSNDINAISKHLEALDIDAALRTTISLQQKRVRLITSALSRLERPVQAAALLSDYEGVFGLGQSAQLNQEIWLLLQRSSASQLTTFQYTGSNENTIAWLELAKDVKLRKANVDEQYLALNDWLDTHPNHPASNALPLELELLTLLPETSPEHIILALPLSGALKNIGNAIRDGFLAAHFNSSRSEQKLDIRTFDTAKNDISSLYDSVDDALTTNTLIVGPISKTEIKKLSNNQRLSIPTLALNNSELVAHQSKLFLFGLDPKHEIDQIAAKLSKLGYQRIGAIAPKTTRNQTLLTHLKEKTAELGGQVVSTSLFNNEKELADSVSQLLATDASAQRSNTLKRLTGINLETEPRRREDIEALVMFVDNDEGKQIKPLLAFNFAQDIPVYASSSVNQSSASGPSKDLNGVRFLDIPWMFTNSGPLHNAINMVTDNDTRYARFYALGADAYLLAPRLSLLQEIESSYADGLTGKLSIMPNGEVLRQLQWAEFSRGRIKPIN